VKNRDLRRELRLAGGTHQGSVLITGGAGFLGTNIARSLLSAGQPVTVFDNLSRPGVERNLRWLRDEYGGLLRIEIGDIRDRAAVQRVVRNARQVIHLAAQVAVTTSILDPVNDFEVNALGTLNLLGALNSLNEPPPLLFTSTNKVYGDLADLALQGDGRRYAPLSADVRARGIDESRSLDFHSPYGCSKGAADQYVLDYARSFGLRTVVFRMSCVYGPHQFGTEDQGWVAHFLLRALRREPITLYGDGQQVRDVLFVDDLVRAVCAAFDNIDTVSGQAFNIGGGAANATSLIELIDCIGKLTPRPTVHFDAWRSGDQRFYVSDTSRFGALTGWRPTVGIADGLSALHDWLVAERVAEQPQPAASDTAWPLGSATAAAAVGE
jgi:CDP-paratose 2-epimerase